MAASTVAQWLAPLASAVVMSGPAYLALRQSRGAAEVEGAATREAITAVKNELRSDIADVREWQTEHTTQHAVSAVAAYRRPTVLRPLEVRNDE